MINPNKGDRFKLEYKYLIRYLASTNTKRVTAKIIKFLQKIRQNSTISKPVIRIAFTLEVFNNITCQFCS